MFLTKQGTICFSQDQENHRFLTTSKWPYVSDRTKITIFWQDQEDRMQENHMTLTRFKGPYAKWPYVSDPPRGSYVSDQSKRTTLTWFWSLKTTRTTWFRETDRPQGGRTPTVLLPDQEGPSRPTVLLPDQEGPSRPTVLLPGQEDQLCSYQTKKEQEDQLCSYQAKKSNCALTRPRRTK